MVTRKSTKHNKKKKKIISSIIGITFGIYVAIHFIATPFVFQGFFMNTIWDDVSLVLLLLLFLEIAILDIKAYVLEQRILIWGYLLIFIVTRYFIPFRIASIVLFVYGVFSLYVVIKQNKKGNFPFNRLSMMTIISLFMIFSQLLDIQMIHSNAFLWISLAIGLPLGVIGIFLTFKYHLFENYNGYRWEIPVSLVILTPLFCYMIVSIANYSLDSSEPYTYEVVITDLDVRTGYRQITQYKVFFELDGKTFEVGVSQDNYYAYHIGDRFDVNLYEGFFHEPYLINES